METSKKKLRVRTTQMKRIKRFKHTLIEGEESNTKLAAM
jgi:hypothetical protein